MEYYNKYLKYKSKYLLLKNNMVGGARMAELTIDDINTKIVELQKEKHTKTQIMAYILSLIMKTLKIPNSEYMVIAGYCLNQMREVGDLDVIVSISAYKKLKESNIVEVSVSKISKDERLFIKFPTIDEEAEIEFFGKKKSEGFPSNKFSLKKLQKENKLDYDNYGNPYYNLETCIELYSDVKKQDGKFIISGKFEISIERVMKNISHLEKIRDFTNDMRLKELCVNNIKYLQELL